MSEIDWVPIRAEYIAGQMGYRKLAEKYGVSENALYAHAKKENWSADRKKYREKRGADLVARYARMDARRMEAIFRASEKMAERIAAMMEDEGQFNRYLVREKQTGELREETLDVYNTKAMSQTVKMLREMNKQMRSLYRIPTQAEAEAQHIARRKLEIEEEKLRGTADEERMSGMIEIAAAETEETDSGTECDLESAAAAGSI